MSLQLWQDVGEHLKLSNIDLDVKMIHIRVTQLQETNSISKQQKLNNYLLEIFASLPCERNLYENAFLFLFFPIGSVEEYFHQVSGAEQTLVRNTRYK